MAAKKTKWKDLGEARKNLKPILDREKANEKRSELLVERLEALYSELGEEALKILDGN